MQLIDLNIKLGLHGEEGATTLTSICGNLVWGVCLCVLLGRGVSRGGTCPPGVAG